MEPGGSRQADKIFFALGFIEMRVTRPSGLTGFHQLQVAGHISLDQQSGYAELQRKPQRGKVGVPDSLLGLPVAFARWLIAELLIPLERILKLDHRSVIDTGAG